MFCEVAEDSPHAEHWVLSIPRAGDPTVLPGQALNPQAGACISWWQVWNGGSLARESICQERYLLFCFAFTRFDLYRTKSFSSPWRKASLLIPVNASTPYRALCQEPLCHDTGMLYFCCETGHRETVEHSNSFTQNSGSEIQVLDPACLVCSGGCPKSLGMGLCPAVEGNPGHVGATQVQEQEHRQMMVNKTLGEEKKPDPL